MNTFGEWYNPFTWFDDSSSTDTTGGSYTGASNDPFGFNLPDFNDVLGGISDSSLFQWQNYWNQGGMMGADLSNPVSTTGGSSFDFLGGFNDFLSGLTGIAQTGLGIYSGVQAIINQSNPSDKIVFLPGTKTPVIERTQGGTTTIVPFATAYPNLVPQVTQAQQNSWIGPALIAGVLGVGLILILKKK